MKDLADVHPAIWVCLLVVYIVGWSILNANCGWVPVP